jgi:hypothetical protein
VVLAAALLGAMPAQRLVRFSGGSVAVRQTTQGQRVTVRNAHGTVTSDSYCNAQTGTFNQAVQFATAVRRAATRNDRVALVGLLHYPLRVNTSPGHSYSVASAGLLLRRFSTTFTPSVMKQLRALQPNDVFCRNGMSMLGSGVMWAGVTKGSLKGAVVNR